MPTEVRQLLFRPVEVVRAIGDYYGTIGRSLPTGQVIECFPEVAESGGVQVRMTIALQSGLHDMGGRQSIVVTPNHLLSALIMFCRSRNVPLPAGASKTLAAHRDQTCLIVRINPKRDPELDRLMKTSTAAA